MSCRVVIRTVEAGTHAVVVERSEGGVVGVLKARLEELTGVPAQRQRLLHRGRELTDEEASAESLGWEENVVLHMVTRVAPPPPGPSPGGQQQQQEQGLPGFDATGMLPPGLADSIASFAESLQQNLSGQGGVAGPFTAVELEDGVFRSSMSQVTDPIGGSLLSGRVPSLDEEGNMRVGSAFDVLNQMLIRLENEDTREDPIPAVQETSLELFRNQQHSREFAAAVTQFLRACRCVLTHGEAGLNRETRQVVNRALVAAGQDPLPLGVQSFPVHGMNDDEEDEDDEEDTAPSSEWVQNISHEDLIVVAAVTTGVLTQRFMRILGQTEAPSGMHATILRTAERLRSISSVSNQEETVRQIRVVGGYLTRLAVSGAELGRSMAYLVSALTDSNLFFLQLYPGYIQIEDDLPRPNVGILHNMEAHRIMSLLPEITGGVPTSTSMAGVVSMAVPMGVPNMRPSGTATGADDQEQQQQQQGNRPTATRVHVHPRVQVRMAGPFPGMRAPPQRQAHGAPPAPQEADGQSAPSAAEEIRRAIPQVEEILSSLGGSQGGQNLANIFSSALRGIASSDINDILNEIREAIRRGLSAAAGQLRSAGNESTSLNSMINVALPEIMNEVGSVLRQRFTQLMNASSQEPTPEEPTRDHDTAVPPPQDTATTEEQEPINNEEQAAENQKKGEEKEKEEAIPDRGESSSMGQTSKKNAKKPVGLGGGLKRRKVAGKKEEGSQEASRKPSAASGSSMQNILGQLAGSASSGRRGGASGDAGNLGALLNSAGPLLGQMFGGTQGQAQEAPLDIEQVLEKEITSDEERKKWQQHIAQCAIAQPSTEDHPGEAYLAAIPSTAGSQGILDAIFGDE